MIILDAVVHWLHLMAAILWVGGMLFTALILQPVMRKTLSARERMPLYHQIGERFKILQWSCFGVLIATGLYKLWGLRGTPEVFRSTFGGILSIKLLLVATAIYLSLMHAFVWGPKLTRLSQDANGNKFKQAARRLTFWGRLNAAIVIGIIFCAALLRINPF